VEEPHISPGQRSPVFFNQHGWRAGWRALLFLLLVIAPTIILGTIFALLKIRPLGADAQTSLLPLPQLAGQVWMFISIGFATWTMSRIESRSMGVYGLPLRNTPIFSSFFAGSIFWGFLPLSVLLLALRAMHVFYFGGLSIPPAQILQWGALWALVFLLVGLSEEYGFRGYLLYTLADGLGFWPAAIVVAALFALAHSLNPGENRIGLIMTALFSLFASMVLWRTGNLWLAVGAHAGWDWGQTFFYGVSDSGLQAQGHLLNPRVHEPAWLSGGTVGPEGSIVALAVLGLMTVLVAMIYRPPKPALIIIPAPTNPL
jgi:uncharacterized protein